MKINGQRPVDFWGRVLETYRKPITGKGQGTAASQDKLELSPEGQFIQELKTLAAQDDTVRTELVEAIRSRLEAGSYSVSITDLAAAILKEIE